MMHPLARWVIRHLPGTEEGRRRQSEKENVTGQEGTVVLAS